MGECAWVRAAGLVLASALAGCSAIIDPDESLLGSGSDVGGVDGGGVDARLPDGALPDTPLLDTGGFDTGGRDTGGSDAGMDAGPCPDGCDDGVPCTVDTCEDDGCVFDPDDGLCAGDATCDPVRGCVDIGCRNDRECEDGDLCNGEETCDRATGVCQLGEPPRCDDSVDCTEDRCDPDTGRCESETIDERCDDGFDCTVNRCRADGCEFLPRDGRCGDDLSCTIDRCEPGLGCVFDPDDDACDDGDACTSDMCGEDGCASFLEDGDGDGFPPSSPAGCDLESDCDDGDPLIYPGAPERCNGLDDDCDGASETLCFPGSTTRCTACGIFPGVRRCNPSGCGQSACGEFEVDTISINPDSMLYTHECGSACAPDDWCYVASAGTPSCAVISDGPRAPLPPGAYEAEFFWGARGTWTFTVFIDGMEVGSVTQSNTEGMFPRTIVPFRVDACGVLSVRVFGGNRIRLYDTTYRRVGE